MRNARVATSPRGNWAVYWDNGRAACGTFPERYATEAEADSAAACIFEDNCAEGVWAEDEAFCEAIRVGGAVGDESAT